jgi:predicted glycogen debranching enzyme
VSLKQRFTKELKKRSERIDFMSSLKNAAEQFVMRKKPNTDIIAGFPWYNCITRQTFVSLPGIAIALNDISIFKNVLDTYASHLKNGLFPENIHATTEIYNSADSSLWYIWAIQQYFREHQKPKEIWRKYGAAIKTIFNAFVQSKAPGIYITENGLIYAEKEKTALTWMNAYVNGTPVTKRNGMPVEINALWFNAICFALDIADMAGDEQFINEWKSWVKKVGTAFNSTFWNEGHKHLADVVTRGVADWSVRPNMVIATALDYSPLTKEQQKTVLSVAKKSLLTKRGLRTLSPDHLRYKGVVEGGPAEREAAVYNGAVWPWLIQFFVEGYLKIHKRGGLPFVKQIMDDFDEEMAEHGIGTLSEMYNGNPPHRAKGAISQAWNVAGVIYAKHLVEDYNE